MLLASNQVKSYICNTGTKQKGIKNGCSDVSSLEQDVCASTTVTHALMSSICKCQHKIEIHKGDLAEVDEISFNSCKGIDHLSFYENKIRRVPGDTFKGLHSLKNLELGGNRLTCINEEWFTDIGELIELHLQKNQITSVPQKMLSYLPKLEKLVLYSNNIASFNIFDFNRLHQLNLYLADNPLACSDIDKLTSYSVLKLNNEIFFNEPRRNKGLTNLKGFDCLASLSKTSTNSTKTLLDPNCTPEAGKAVPDKSSCKIICSITHLAIAAVVTGINGLILILLVFKFKITEITF